EAEGVADRFEGEDVGAVVALEPAHELEQARGTFRALPLHGIGVRRVAEDGEHETLLARRRGATADRAQREDERLVTAYRALHDAAPGSTDRDRMLREPSASHVPGGRDRRAPRLPASVACKLHIALSRRCKAIINAPGTTRASCAGRT